MLPITLGVLSLFGITSGTANLVIVQEPIQQIALTTIAYAEEVPLEVKPDFSSTTTIREYINKYAEEYGVSSSSMWRVMMCESSGNKDAINLRDPNGGSKGLFQFQPQTYKLWAEEIGETRDIWDAEAQIKVTAYAFSKGRQSAWSCWKK